MLSTSNPMERADRSNSRPLTPSGGNLSSLKMAISLIDGTTRSLKLKTERMKKKVRSKLQTKTKKPARPRNGRSSTRMIMNFKKMERASNLASESVNCSILDQNCQQRELCKQLVPTMLSYTSMLRDLPTRNGTSIPNQRLSSQRYGLAIQCITTPTKETWNSCQPTPDGCNFSPMMLKLKFLETSSNLTRLQLLKVLKTRTMPTLWWETSMAALDHSLNSFTKAIGMMTQCREHPPVCYWYDYIVRNSDMQL